MVLLWANDASEAVRGRMIHDVYVLGLAVVVVGRRHRESREVWEVAMKWLWFEFVSGEVGRRRPSLYTATSGLFGK